LIERLAFASFNVHSPEDTSRESEPWVIAPTARS
jgi:hypothetical protein